MGINYWPKGGDTGEGGVLTSLEGGVLTSLEGGVLTSLEGRDWAWAVLNGWAVDWSCIDRLSDFIDLSVIFRVSEVRV